jgi:hypothetical protein
VYGEQLGIGIAETEAWWLGVALTTLACEETIAAEAPATKSPRAKARTANFIVLVPLGKSLKVVLKY